MQEDLPDPRQRPTTPSGPTIIQQILELARWAPSGDNTQPWRFETIDNTQFVVHGRDTRNGCVYDLRGHASQIAIGTLLETIHLASSSVGYQCSFERRTDEPETKPTFDVRLTHAPDLEPDPLSRYIRSRVTQRRPMRGHGLSDDHRQALTAAVAPSYKVIWLEGLFNKLRMARLLFQNAKIRLTIPEAYAVHRKVIQWNARFSEDRIPDKAIGLDRCTTRIMQWAMVSWKRVHFMNQYLAGTVAPRIQLDVFPALRCGAHFVLVADDPLRSLDDFVAGGRALQRFWLTATSLGLLLQPEMTPLIFWSYVHDDIRFTKISQAFQKTRRLYGHLNQLLGSNQIQRAVFMGRIGAGRTPNSRSTRMPTEWLISTSCEPDGQT